MEIDVLIEEWAEAGYSDEKLAELQGRHPDVDWLKIAGTIMRETGQMTPAFEVSDQEIWQRIEDEVEGRAPEEVEASEEPEVIPLQIPRRRTRRRWRRYAAAAVFLLAMIFLFTRGGSDGQMRETFAGEMRLMRLPDGSQVALAAQSKLSWEEDEWEKQRTLDLEGEAFFDVKPGSPFSVQTEAGTIEAVGTSFNVRIRDEVLYVACKSGVVDVRNDTRTTQLTEGKSVVIQAGGQHQPAATETSKIGAWRSGMQYYKNTPLRQVLDEVERQFGYTVTTAEYRIDDIPCNGFFSNEDLDAAMQQLCKPLGLSYEINSSDKTVTVR